MSGNCWHLKINKTTSDLSTINYMYWRSPYGWEPNVKVVKGDPTDLFVALVEKQPTPLMLAITAPRGQQREAWKGLIAAGFKPIASGLRTPGHTGGKYLFLWGKKYEARGCKGYVKYMDFSCCGAVGCLHNSKKDFNSPVFNSWGKLTVHRIPAGSKYPIPKELTLFASTKVAKYYVENFAKIFNTL